MPLDGPVVATAHGGGIMPCGAMVASSVPAADPASLLRAAGVRATPQRQLVLQVLREAGDRHLTAEDVCRAVQNRFPRFNRSTTYRVLETLCALGVVQQTQLGEGAAHFEVVDRPERHHHLVCVRCGRVQNIPPDVISEISVRLAERHRFHIGTVDLMIRGECASCRERPRPA